MVRLSRPARRQPLGQLGSYGGVDHDALGGDDLFDLAADVRGVSGRPPGGQPGQHPLHRGLPVQDTDRSGVQLDGAVVVRVAGRGKLRQPARGQLGTVLRGDLVRPSVGPGPDIPGPAQRRAGVFAGMRRGPLGLVPVQVPGDLRGPGAERPDMVGELPNFSSAVQGEAVGGERGPELRVGSDRGMPDPVDGIERISNADGV